MYLGCNVYFVVYSCEQLTSSKSYQFLNEILTFGLTLTPS